MLRFSRSRGQGLVEFALILPALLMIVLSIIEAALLFQSYLAIQHAAREAARYAVAYQPPQTYSEPQGKLLLQGIDPGNPAYKGESETEWHSRRVRLIKQRALDQAMGIRTVYPALDEADFTSLFNKLGFFGVRVWGFPAIDEPEKLDHPGLQGLPLRVRVYYRWEPLDPLIRAIVPNGVLLTGEAVMINEGIQVGLGAVAPPTFAPPPTIAGPTTIPTDPVSTPTPEPTATYTPTPTPAPPTATPPDAYVIVVDSAGQEKPQWLLDEFDVLRSAYVEPRQHTDPGPYRVYWTSNCDQRTYLGLELSTSGGIANARLPSPVGLLPGDSYLCDPLQQGQVYKGTISTCSGTAAFCSDEANDTAQQQVSILVPVKYPDLIVSQILLPRPISAGAPFIVGVVVTNQGESTITDTFDIDIYADPEYTPILKGQPGLLASGSGSAKQWYGKEIPPGGSTTLEYVLNFPLGGAHTVWAQVDTSAEVDESDEDNNITGPVDLTAYCSDKCDDFDVSPLDAKWTLAEIGSGTGGSGKADITADGEVRIEGVGSQIWDGSDGKFFLLNQGAYSGNFDVSVKVTDYPKNETGSMAGLMVREALADGSRYAAIGVVNQGGPRFQAVVRDAVGAVPIDPCGGTSGVSGDAWVRITREGEVLTLYTSGDGENWNTSACLQVTIPGLATSVVPGIFTAPMAPMTKADTGWRSPTANAADTGGDGNGFERWSNRAYADGGGGYAESRDNGTGGGDFQHTDRHRYYDYNLGVPAGAVIYGVEVRMDWWVSSSSGVNRLRIDLSWDGGSTWTAVRTDEAWPREPTSERSKYLGGATDTWGRTWSASDFSNGNFRVRVHAYSSDTSRDFFLDWIPVKVYYATSSGSAVPDGGEFDTFQLCPLDPTPPSTRTKPPLLKECGSVLSNPDFYGGVLSPWVEGLELQAVVADGTYSCDLDGRANYGFSMFFRCDRLPAPPFFYPLHPQAYQEFTVPQFISTTEEVDVEMSVSLYYGVPKLDIPPAAPNPYVQTYGRVEDKLQVLVTAQDDTPLSAPYEIAQGAPDAADQDKWDEFTGDVAPFFLGGDSLLNHVGETVRLRLEAPNLDTDGDGYEDGDSKFYVDQVRCDICTTVIRPPYRPGTVRRVGGKVTVLVEGFAQSMQGVDVWAMQLPDGVTPPEALAYYTTYSIHDSTYNFFNLNPGIYRIYAQVWVSGVLYTATAEVDLTDPVWMVQEKLDVHLTLQ
jgi:hypothetical protein